MGGTYTRGEVGCQICKGILQNNDKVIITNEATYNEVNEVMDFEPYTEKIYHKSCYDEYWKKFGFSPG